MIWTIIKGMIPSLTRTKAKVSSVDTLLSKRGETTKTEVILAMSEKILRTLVYAYMVWAIINNKVNFGEILKLVLTQKN